MLIPNLFLTIPYTYYQGTYIPAERCHLIPVDRIFARLGGSHRLMGIQQGDTDK